MEAHVNGPFTPMPLGELRQAILAVVVGNPLFSDAERLRANHNAYDCEQPQRLALWLRNVQREAARRDWVVKAQTLASQYSSLADEETLEAEMQRVERYAGLPASIRPELRWLFDDATTHARRLTIVGAAYKMVLRHLDCLERVDFELN